VAVRENGVLYFLLADHLGSTTTTVSASGAEIDKLLYKPGGNTPTDFLFTGQIQEAGLGLYFYNARWYDPSIMQWTSPDTLIPDPYNPLDWNRYAYVRFNPVNFNDPTGHDVGCTASNPDCLDSNGLTERSKAEMKLAVTKKLKVNGWDLVPVVADVRGIVRGAQVVKWAAEQPEFMDQQKELQSWQNECYGQCHYTEATENDPGPSLAGGPMPETPLVDTYSEGMGEIGENVIDLGLTATTAKVMRGLPEPKINTPRFGIRVAPFGNAGRGPLVSQLPHFHFRIGPYLEKSYYGFGWGWHHPWDDFARLFKLLMK